MSTLAEIETAAARLPREEQEQLIRFLAAQRHVRAETRQPLRQSRRGFPVSRGAAAFGNADVARIESEADAE